MTSAVRFSAGYARVRALKGRLWTSLDRALVLRAGVQARRAAAQRRSACWCFRDLMRWYAIVLRMYPAARPLVTWMLRLHEIENLKLLWRAALRGRPPIQACWRPLDPLGTRRVRAAGRAARATGPPPGADALRRDRADAAAQPSRGLCRPPKSASIGGPGRACTTKPLRLRPREAAARRLVRLLILEHDLDLLRRGTSFGLEADLVAKSTVVLSRERRIAGAGARGVVAARPTARSPGCCRRPCCGSRRRRRLGRRPARRAAGAAAACRRAFVGWPFELAPAIAALLLRDAQARAADEPGGGARRRRRGARRAARGARRERAGDLTCSPPCRWFACASRCRAAMPPRRRTPWRAAGSCTSSTFRTAAPTRRRPAARNCSSRTARFAIACAARSIASAVSRRRSRRRRSTRRFGTSRSSGSASRPRSIRSRRSSKARGPRATPPSPGQAGTLADAGTRRRARPERDRCRRAVRAAVRHASR